MNQNFDFSQAISDVLTAKNELKNFREKAGIKLPSLPEGCSMKEFNESYLEDCATLEKHNNLISELTHKKREILKNITLVNCWYSTSDNKYSFAAFACEDIEPTLLIKDNINQQPLPDLCLFEDLL